MKKGKFCCPHAQCTYSASQRHVTMQHAKVELHTPNGAVTTRRCRPTDLCSGRTFAPQSSFYGFHRHSMLSATYVRVCVMSGEFVSVHSRPQARERWLRGDWS